MMNSKIKKIKAREILDSRGNPTVEVKLETNLGVFRASVPSGASEGKYEALELRDGGKRYFGKGVLRAIKNVNEIIGPKLKGKDVKKQKEIDDLMKELDGTENKSRLGANSIYGVSLATCRAGAKAKNLPLFRYISQLIGNLSPNLALPFSSFNILNGGLHAGNDLDIQEFMVVPEAGSFSENLRLAAEIYHKLKEILKEKYGERAINVGDEGGFAPPLKFSKEALDLISQAIENLGYQGKIKLILDCAASQFFREGKYKLEGSFFTKGRLLKYYSDLIQKYPIIALEDPFSEEDWDAFQKITEKIGEKILIIGDDLLVTNPKRIMEAERKKACNGLLLKIDQIGTVSEAIKAAKLASQFGWKIMVSHRSGDTCDNFISDFAVGISTNFIKAGAPARGERVAKYNRLLEIEEEVRSGR
ncbi:enolase [Parcubacteria bacterium DG_74_2]|nr:MAG: enolase [Parcubacteria bacterium DG_74_2]